MMQYQTLFEVTHQAQARVLLWLCGYSTCAIGLEIARGLLVAVAMQPCDQPDKKIQIGFKPVGHLSKLLLCPFQGTWIYCNRFLAQFRTEWCRSHGILLSVDSGLGVQVLISIDPVAGFSTCFR